MGASAHLTPRESEGPSALAGSGKSGSCRPQSPFPNSPLPHSPAPFRMAVKGKGKQVATDAPGASRSSGKRRKGTGDAGPSSSSAKRCRRSGVLQFVDDAAGVDDDYEDNDGGESEEHLDDGTCGDRFGSRILALRHW
jgi:hypothetical protein